MKARTTPPKTEAAPLPRVGYSIEESANILGVSRITLMRELSDGRGPVSFFVRGRRLFTLEALQDYAVSQQRHGELGLTTPRAIPVESEK